MVLIIWQNLYDSHLVFKVLSAVRKVDFGQDGKQGIDYGQEPPGVISKSEDLEFGSTFSPDGKEIYYTVRKNKTELPIIMMSQMEKGKWSTPVQLDVQGDGDLYWVDIDIIEQFR